MQLEETTPVAFLQTAAFENNDNETVSDEEDAVAVDDELDEEDVEINDEDDTDEDDTDEDDTDEDGEEEPGEDDAEKA